MNSKAGIDISGLRVARTDVDRERKRRREENNGRTSIGE